MFQLPPEDSAENLLALTALQSIDQIGSVSLKNLLSAAGSVQHILDGGIDPHTLSFLSKEARRGLLAFLRDPKSTTQWELAEKQLAWLRAHSGWAITSEHDRYPAMLLASDSAPAVLYGRGDIDVLNKICISIVGTRKPSISSCRFAEQLAQDLATAGVTVVSGMALGIDTAAHTGALLAVNGCTTAVWAAGLDHCYPSANRALANDIIDHGCIVSEMPLGTPVKAGLFPRRNHIVSGLSCGVVVVEAAIKSGSMITARAALQQNREVFAVPGVVGRESTGGCHLLIKQGAALVENAQDVLEGLLDIRHLPVTERRVSEYPLPNKAKDLPPPLKVIYDLIETPSMPFEVLANRSTVSISELNTALIDLELMDLITVEVGMYSRTC